MKINENHPESPSVNYKIGTQTESTPKEQKFEVPGQVNIDKEYGLTKPQRRVIKAKITEK
ncbi:MAG: hypothetical protein JW715_05365 [Sedimentisphaerales bacterium]|nr:hypothetical protein [Sedimentisphaerales bacterium]